MVWKKAIVVEFLHNGTPYIMNEFGRESPAPHLGSLNSALLFNFLTNS